MYKLLSNYTKEEDVVAAFACAYHENPTSDTFSSVAAFFSDFQVVGLLPDGAESGEGKPKRYVSRKISEERSLDKTYASNVKNLTLQPVTASQNLSNSWTSTVSSSVNRSESYSFSEGIKIGVEKEFAIAKVTAEFSFTATQAFTEGWSKGQSLSKSGVVADSVAVPLPPYTNVILEQGNSVTTLETKYNCPVGLKYKVRLVGYNSTGAQTYDQSGAWTFETDARADLYKRAVRNGSYDSEMGGDSEHMPVKWTVATTVPGVSDAIKAAAYHVPMTATGGKFTEHVETIFTDVKTIVPTHQLSTVKLAKPDVTVISGGDFSYDNLNYLHQDMDVGDSSFTGLLKVEGLNTYGADYYGFYQPQGHWKVLDEDGVTELDPQTGPIQLADPASANTKYTAMEPGTYYLKYCINDNTYPKFKLDGSPVEAGINPSAPDRANGDETEYLTDADINSRAMLEITVTEDETAPSHTVGVTGSYPKAEVGKYAPKLEDGGLVVSIKGDDGVEIEEDYTWQAQELPARGITVQADGTVSFSKAGTFHVRAVCQHGIASEWVEVEAYERTTARDTKAPRALALTYNGQDQRLVTPGEAEGGEMVYWVDGPYANDAIATEPENKDEYTTDIPQGREAGRYHVWYYVKGDATHDNSAVHDVPVTILHAPSKPGEPTPGALVYNGQAQALVEAGVAQGGTVMYRLSESEDWREEIPKAIDAGDYTVWYYVKGDKNHNDTEPDYVQATIEKKPLLVTALDAEKTYGDADPALTWTADGLAGRDSLIGKLERAKGENVGTYAIRQGSLSASDNYVLYFNEGLFTIEPRPLTVKAKDASALYGDADPDLEYTVEGLVGPDRLTGRLARKDGDSAGTYPITRGSLAASGNYDLTFEDAVFTILKRDVTITARDASKTYGNADPTLTYTADGLVGLDQPVGALSRSPGEAVGAYAIAQGSLALSNNYNLTFTGGTLTIAPRRLAVTADVQHKTQGEADPTLTYTATGMVNGDTLTGALSRESGEDAGTYAITQGTLAASGNYDLAFTGATLTISAKPVQSDFTLLAKLTPSGKNSLSLSWTKVNGAQGYDVFFRKCDGDLDFPRYKSVSKLSCRIKNLKGGVCYKAYVQAWYKQGGKKVYIGEPSPTVHCIVGGYSKKLTNAKSVKLTPSGLTLGVGSSQFLKATVKKAKAKRKIVDHVTAVRYYSSDPAVAVVSGSGQVTAVAEGACTIYAMANNGMRAATKVVVVAAK